MTNRVLLILLLNAISFQCLSQTKKETIDWLLQKFDKFKKDRYHSYKHWEESKIAGKEQVTTSYFYSNYDYSIKEDTLTIKCSFLEQNTGQKDIKLVVREEIIISEISNIRCNGGVLYFDTYDYTIKTFSNGKVNKDLSKTTLSGFNCDGEEDLGNRVVKALNHLKTFYPRVKLKEPF
jgi:hypothetical protein